MVSVSGIDRERAGSKTKMVFLMPSSFTVYLCIIHLYCWEKKKYLLYHTQLHIYIEGRELAKKICEFLKFCA